MRILLCMHVLFCFSIAAFAQTGSVEGVVSASGKPLFAAPVGITEAGITTVTDVNGYFRLNGLKPGNYVLSCSYMGFEKLNRRIEVTSGKVTRLSINLMENSSPLNEVVITGTMKEVSRLESTVPVEVYTTKFFRKNPSASLFESVGMINGVKPQLNCNVCNTGDIHINGLEGPYTMITIDGMPIVSGLSTVYGLHGIPNSIIQRVEVVKGPASALYGSEAVGGLINIITKSPNSAPSFSIDAGTTSRLEHSLDAAFKFRAGKANAFVSASHYNANERFDVNNDNFTDVTLQKRTSVFSKWDFKRKEYRQAAFALRYIYEDRFGGEMDWSPQWRGSDSIYGESIYTKRWEITGFYQLPLKEKLVLSLSLNNHNQDSYYGITPFMADQSIAFAQLTWDKKVRHHDLMMGTAFRYTYYDDNTAATFNFNELHSGNKADVSSLPGCFIQDELTVSKAHKVLAGIRYDYNSRHGGIITPRIGYKWTTGVNSVLRLNSGTGFRVVNLFTEDHAALTGARKVVITESLDPERSWNANINYIKQLNVRFGYINVDASAFYTRFTNQILPDYNYDPKSIIYKNLDGFAISRGLSVNTDFDFMSGLKILAGATFMDAFVSAAQVKRPLLFAPAFSGTWSVSYTFPASSLSVDLTGTINSPMHLPVLPEDFRPDQSPWYSLINMQVNYKVNKRCEIYCGGKNLLNFIPSDPIMRPFDPFNKNIAVNNPRNFVFDPSYNYAPIQGIRGFIGFRYTMNN